MDDEILPLDNLTMAEAACGRANLYELLVAVFGSLPNRDVVIAVKSQSLQSLLDGCYGLDNPQFKAGVDYMNSYRSSIELKPDEDSLTELSVDQTRILRISGYKNLKPPYEGLYTHAKDTRASTLEVKTFYREAGLLLDNTVHEPPVMAYQHYFAGPVVQEPYQPPDGDDIQEVGGLIQEQQVRFRHQHLGQVQPDLEPAGKFSRVPAKIGFSKTQARKYPLNFPGLVRLALRQAPATFS